MISSYILSSNIPCSYHWLCAAVNKNRCGTKEWNCARCKVGDQEGLGSNNVGDKNAETFQHGHGVREVIQDEPGANIEKLGDETEELNNNLNEVDQAFDECIASVKEWLRRN